MVINTRVDSDPNAPPVTQILAKFVSTHPSKGWDAQVEREARRTFMNWVGCAVGAANHESARAALAAIGWLEPSKQASVLGRNDKLDMASAALVNGITSHTFDFDDTHLRTIIHPAGPVASAALALAEHQGLSGRAVIDALVLGVDVECRVGNCIYPNHYDRGWHITGSAGVLGAAAACARLLQLDEGKTMMALGIAASQPIGLREQFGTMTKPFHLGAAARAGLLSALLAKNGFTASARALEAPRGLIQVYSDKRDWSEITTDLGKRFEISINTYKPFACGIVIHPTIDAGTQLRAKGVRADDIERVELKVHSLVLELTGKKEPQDGLQAKFSVYHGFCCGLVFGQAGETEYEDDIVRRDDMVALRRKVVATVDDSISEDQADVTAVLKDGRREHIFVKHAIGSLERPMSDADLERKFHSLADHTIGSAKAAKLIAACWDVANTSDLKRFTELARP